MCFSPCVPFFPIPFLRTFQAMRTHELFEIRDVQQMKVLVHFLLVRTGFLKYHPMNIQRYFKRPQNLVYIQNFMLEFELSQATRVVI